jgi:hypothetical protein
VKRVREFLHVNGRNENKRWFLPHFCEIFHRYFNEECCLWDLSQGFILLIGTPYQRVSTNLVHCMVYKESFLRMFCSQLHILRSGGKRMVYSRAWLHVYRLGITWGGRGEQEAVPQRTFSLNQVWVNIIAEGPY